MWAGCRRVGVGVGPIQAGSGAGPVPAYFYFDEKFLGTSPHRSCISPELACGSWPPTSFLSVGVDHAKPLAPERDDFCLSKTRLSQDRFAAFFSSMAAWAAARRATGTR